MIEETEPGAIIVSPQVFDALRKSGLLKQVGVVIPDSVYGQYGYDEDERGNVRCWLVDGASAALNPSLAYTSVRI